MTSVTCDGRASLGHRGAEAEERTEAWLTPAGGAARRTSRRWDRCGLAAALREAHVHASSVTSAPTMRHPHSAAPSKG